MSRRLDSEDYTTGFGEASDSRTLFSQTMGLVAVTMGLFALGSLGMGAVLRGVCLPDRNEIRSPGSELGDGWTSVRLRNPHGLGDSTNSCVLREYEPASRLAGPWSDGALHDRAGRGRLCDKTRSVRARASCILGPPGSHRLRHHHRLRAGTERCARLLLCRTGDLCRSHHVRFSTPSPEQWSDFCTTAGGIGLSRCPQRVPLLFEHLQQEEVVKLGIRRARALPSRSAPTSRAQTSPISAGRRTPRACSAECSTGSSTGVPPRRTSRSSPVTPACRSGTDSRTLGTRPTWSPTCSR